MHPFRKIRRYRWKYYYKLQMKIRNSILPRGLSFRRRDCWMQMLTILGILAISSEIVQLAIHSQNESLSQADLQRILLSHGVSGNSIAPENLDWFKEYLLHLKKVLKQSKHVEKSDEERERERLANLNKMDMPTRKIHGVREPCLDLLPEHEITSLVLPPPSDTPMEKLSYFSVDADFEAIEGETGVVEGQKGRSIESEMFAGKQTWGEREKSFQVQRTMEVHCGFCGSGTGFDIQEEDKKYMNSCKVVVSTCTFGGGDDLAQPIGMTNSSLEKVCYVAFWDNITLAMSAETGFVLNSETRMMGLWRIIVVQNLPFVDQRRNGKIPKMLAHRLFPNAQFSIWVDAKSQFRRDPYAVLESLLWRSKHLMAISEHGARSCIYKEGEAIVDKHKATPEEVAVQLYQYKLEGVPENATVDGHKALAEASVIIREHTMVTNLFMCLWFNEVVRFSSRDQISFAYVLRRLEILHPNFFPVCTRKALVNNLGHRRKPKLASEAELDRFFSRRTMSLSSSVLFC